MALPVGTVLGESYRLTRLIGTGGMGAIYEAARLRGGGDRVAVKVMSKEMLAYPEASARFRREVKVTSELDHPHIVKVVDFGVSQTGQPYLVMEYLEGEDLDHCLNRVGSLPLATTVQIVKQLAAALAAAHAEGIVHRDLKPGNVFLLRVAGGGVFVKVVDFGISKVLKSSATKLTAVRAVFGTPEFMAPEQAAGRVDWIDHRSDQWSLACVAWRTLSGQLPFWRPDVNALLNQVAAEDPNPLTREEAARVPPAIDKVLRRALSKLREDRFPTINAFARAFEAAAGPGRAATPTPVEAAPARRESGRQEIARPESARRERAAPAPATARRRGRARVWLSAGVVGLGLAYAAWVFRSEIPLSKWRLGGAARSARSAAGGATTIPHPTGKHPAPHK
jgi:serine/threonine-protein kinase